MVSAKVAIETLLEDATYGIRVYDDAGAAGSGTLTSGTGTMPVSPLTLVHGAQNVTISTFGTFTLLLPAGSIATVATGGWVVTASPVSAVEGSTVITVEAGGAGTITITIATVPILLAGHVIDHWPGKNEFASHAYVITLGPVIAAVAEVASLGGFNKLTVESVQVDVWVMENRGATYAAEKTRSDLVQEVDRCLLHYVATPGTGFMTVNASSWRDLDETGLKRSTMTVEVLYEKVRV